MPKASDNVFPRFLVSEGGSTSTPAAGRVTIYAKADGLLYQKDDAGTETVLAGNATTLATDTLWDTAGDLVVGSGANTAAKLAIGAVGAHLSRLNGTVQWNSGTSNPTGVAGDRYWRSDLGLEIYYDGTRWLSTTLYKADNGETSTLSAINTGPRLRPLTNGLDIYIVAWDLSIGMFSTNDGSNYWTYALQSRNGADTSTAISTLNTSLLAGGTWHHITSAIGAVSDTNGAVYNFTVNTTVKTGAPSNLLMVGGFTFRLIVT